VSGATRVPRAPNRGRLRPLLPGGAGVAAAVLAGVAQALSFAPIELWWLQILATGALVALLVDETPRAAALRGWAFGVGWLLAGLWWLYISLHFYGFLPAWLSVAAVALLAASLSLYYALAAWGWARMRRERPLVDALLFAAVWLLAELARGKWFTGFPWIAGGYAHTSGALKAWAPYVGVYGIGAIAAWVSAAAALTIVAWHAQWRQGRERGIDRAALALSPLLLPAVVLALGAALPQGFTTSTGTLSVTLMQTNIGEDVKFDPDHIRATLAWHRDRFDAARGQLVVTPESSLPVLPDQIPKDLWLDYQRPFDAPGRAVLVGIFTGDEVRGYSNTLVGLDATHHMTDGSYYHYAKRHLLPFGEFVPPGFQWMLDLMKVPIGQQTPGVDTAPLLIAGQRVRPLICYEDLFGEDFADSMAGPGAATLLVNSTNLAWFGKVMIQDQHLQFSRMRALEFQRGQVRATNTGATAVIDYHGDVTARLPPLVEGQLDATVEGRTGTTPYAAWVSRYRLWPLWGLAIAVLLVGAMRSRR
jgi:apolipoprotein N-acyltransferase